ncbi:Uncharacterized protein SCF082_LOCUS49984 [Durusdinium trenchii]|uniref:EF-hand domain-containing protein n=1 Tax=Durusdinium trenchii TaxID=1381693 RepID=A0ABP0S4Y6_9DINO
MRIFLRQMDGIDTGGCGTSWRSGLRGVGSLGDVDDRSCHVAHAPGEKDHAKDEEASAAAGAASYWRGTRVRQEEEQRPWWRLNLPAPQIQIDAPRQDGETGENGSMSIEYDGYDLVQECLEYYVDKSLEARNQRRVYEKELHALNQRENADRSLHKDLGLSLRCLARFFWHYPVVIFHTNGSTQAELAWLKSLAPPHMKVSFEEVLAHYRTFDAPSLTDTSYEEVRKYLLEGRPFVITDGARGLPMSVWDCDFVKQAFPQSRIRQEGGRSERNAIKMNSNWQQKVSKYPGAEKYPEGAPRIRPFYWDIAKAYEDEKERQWGKDPRKVVQQIVKTSQVPYWLPPQSATEMGHSSEMWFHPKGAGARAHMDPHCKTTVSFCFSGQRKWRMMVPPPNPHPAGYFDGEIYGRGEWRPTFELLAPNGSAVVVYPGMVHETLSTGEECSSSVSQTFEHPVPAAYFRAFWPRFARVKEDVGGCAFLVEQLVTLRAPQAPRVRAAPEVVARKAAKHFAHKVDFDGDGVISEMELLRASGQDDNSELISFHDTNRDGKVTTAELVASYVMFATSLMEEQPGRTEL